MITNTRRQTFTTLSRSDIIPLLNASLAALVECQHEIDRLNVYPVPDGDTGTNMVLTMKSVRDEAVKVGDTSIKELAKAVIYGSLIGARGNSGVILSQIIRGALERIEKHNEITSEVIIEALINGAEVAYQAVKKPVEGTMLTVIKDMARAAESLLGKEIEPADLIGYVVEEGNKSVERTPDLLPILKESGVVDAGGYGLVVMMKGILSALKGVRLDSDAIKGANSLTVNEENIEYAYCAEFILKSGGIDMEDLENRLYHLGDSVLVVGMPELTKVHVHTNDPGKVLQIATELGLISEVQINNIIEQSVARAQALREEGRVLEETGIGIVAVSSGGGISEILLSLGVSVIVNGGQSMNLSTADLVRAVNNVPNSEVIILPNNKNVILSAQQVVGLTEKTVMVIPTRSIPEAFSALLAFDGEAPLDKNVEMMIDKCGEVKTGEVAHAIRDSENGSFMKDDFIGLYNDEIKVSGSDLLQVTTGLLEEMIDDGDEVVTVLAGNQVSEDQVERLVDMIEDKFSDLDIDVHIGGQPIYSFIISVE
ncbi:MAG: DAK2 domain-containing protein [Actinobacteria bacterium]|nr:DAK2 domain-containing protein [Actinomycetota bacterium]